MQKKRGDCKIILREERELFEIISARLLSSCKIHTLFGVLMMVIIIIIMIIIITIIITIIIISIIIIIIIIIMVTIIE